MDIMTAFENWGANDRLEIEEGETLSEKGVALEAFAAGVDYVCDKWEAAMRSGAKG